MSHINLIGKTSQNKRKLVNDPVFGFINIPSEIIFDLIEHPWFQRLRRIKQLGLSYYVFPGAVHTRFQHVLGAMHLLQNAITVIRSKGHIITEEEAEAATIAILLHDIGHAPLSHSLERKILNNSHEELTLQFMKCLDHHFKGKLSLAIKIFTNQYHKKFLHQLVSSQLDMDRLDFLRRDSFFTGVSEGVIGSERIIKMLNVSDDNLVIDSKGIYSIEKFLIARRLMYWQVYLHKTVIAVEKLVDKIIDRSRFVIKNEGGLFGTPELLFFLKSSEQLQKKEETLISHDLLVKFAQLDDFDLLTSIKVWTKHTDKILSTLCNNLINRKLFKIELQNKPFAENRIHALKQKVQKVFKISKQDCSYFVFSQTISNTAYDPTHDEIYILYKEGSVKNLTKASDILNIPMLSKNIKKYFLCYPKEILI